MSKTAIALCAVVAIAAGYFGVRWLCRPEPVVAGPAPVAEITYICRETKELSRGPRQPTPAVNPRTGRATLVQALYCPQCRRWFPAPPPAVQERLMAGPVCPKDNAHLLETEPANETSATPAK